MFSWAINCELYCEGEGGTGSASNKGYSNV